ncbi:MAG: calcium/sodium antiporter [Bacteroidales bacterium]|nr:calcium/sodium antiporter [Bacteroidales bacterium]
MFVEITLLLTGLALVLLGADGLVEGASQLARRWGISEFVIGLTIVAIGTSAPEMVVSFIAAFEKNSDMAVGNIIGSNIFNTALILGLSAIIHPLAITRNNLHRDIPLNIIVTSALILFGMKHTLLGVGQNGLSFWEGLLFVACFGWYMVVSFRNDKSDTPGSTAEGPALSTGEGATKQGHRLIVSLAYVVVGLAALIGGGQMFVSHAQTIAQMAGLSDKFIAITVLAAGTSMPELATSCVAAAKGKGQLALGNVIGSNTANILLILGGAAIIHPLDMNAIKPQDYMALFATALCVIVCAFTFGRKRIDRIEGAILLLIECAYMGYLMATC